MPFSASAVCGVDARVERVVFVRTGVRWMCGFIRVCAAVTASRVKEGVWVLMRPMMSETEGRARVLGG